MRVGLPSAPTASVIGPASVVTSTSRSGPSVLTGEILASGASATRNSRSGWWYCSARRSAATVAEARAGVPLAPTL